MELIKYSKCSTCKKAEKFLQNKSLEFENREIKEKTPTVEEMKEWTIKFHIKVDQLFNTSGIKYRELNLKEKRNNMSDNEKLKLLSMNAMLIKRPILVMDNHILIGFNEKTWNTYFENNF